jgi:UDP-2,3-diacylglucosamine pyrophosphatase LpxH
MGRTVLLSDLHMGAGGRRDQFRADAELTALLEIFAADPTVSDLVLLGDTFDLAEKDVLSGAQPRAVCRLRDVLKAHPDVVSSLRSVVRRGMRLHVVHGNHDVELVDAQVQTTLRTALATEDMGGLRFLPWLYHVPGLLLAEHGNQHHDLNAFDTVIRPVSDDGRVVAESFGAQLSRLRDRHEGAAVLPPALWAATCEAVRLCGRTRRARRTAYRREVLPAYAAEVGLAEDCVRRLDLLGQHQPAEIVARLVRQTLHPTSPGYLVGAAQAVRDALGDAAPPLLVMGHSHGADARLLSSHGSDTPVVYLNTGSWSLRGPRPRDTTLPPVTKTWVEIEPPRGRSPARARVLHLAGDGARTVLAEADATGRVVRARGTASRTVIRQC